MDEPESPAVPPPADVSGRLERASSRSSSVDTLAELLKVDDDHRSLWLSRIGYQRRRETLPLLVPFLAHEDAKLRAAAARAVMRADPMSAAPLIRPLLGDTNSWVVECAAQALRSVATVDDVDALSAAAEHPDRSVRDEVAEALGATGDAAALPALERLVADRTWWVRTGARSALGEGAIPGADAVLGAAPRTARAVRTAKRAERLRDAPAPLVTPLTATLARATVLLGLDAAIILVAPLALDGASLLGTAVGAFVALLVAHFLFVTTTDGGALSVPARHDRARAHRTPLPSEAYVVGTLGLVLRLWRDPGRILASVSLTAAVVGLEVVLPAGGVVSGALGAAFLVVAVVMWRTRRLLAASPKRAYVQIDAAGRQGQRVWLDLARR